MCSLNKGLLSNVLDLLEALNKVLTRVVVAMWLGVATENIVIEAPELRGIVDP